jgi:RNA polymerase sigma factor (sigma-70 family)
MSAAELALQERLKQQELQVLYRNHHSWLQGWLRHKLGNAFDAADMAQDVFLRILSRQSPTKAAEPRAYLSTIARGMVIDHWRRRELEQAWLKALAAVPAAELPSAESRLVWFETLIAIDRVLDTLKPPVRQAFLWAQLEGLSCPQIALRLDVSLATAERYVAKALRRCYALRFESHVESHVESGFES